MMQRSINALQRVCVTIKQGRFSGIAMNSRAGIGHAERSKKAGAPVGSRRWSARLFGDTDHGYFRDMSNIDQRASLLCCIMAA
jgi:hypothetical protein